MFKTRESHGEYLDTGGNKTKDMHAMHLPNFIRISGVLFILVAVIEHFGPTIVSGHYIAVVRWTASRGR